MYLVRQWSVLGDHDPYPMCQRNDVCHMLGSAWLSLERDHFLLHQFASAVQLDEHSIGMFGAARLHVEGCHGYLQRHSRRL